MTICEHVLEGCAPIPLAGYLKALGVFRLVAEQKDENARGFWRNERFVLKTRLTREELVGFFLDEYRPTPVISPWNAGSGFYYREGKSKEKDAGGKRIKTGVRSEATAATRFLDHLLGSKAARLTSYRKAVSVAKAALGRHRLDAAPGDAAKAALIRSLRSEMPAEALDWIDAAATVAQLEVIFPPLLGSGGNDGNLDFSTTVIQTIVSLLDVESGAPSEAAATLLEASLFADITRTGGGMAISQFAPGSIGAANSGVGFNGSLCGNAWDIVLGLEGALVMSTALVRRIGTDGDAASFPFMVSRRGVLGAGAGNVAPADENARGEFWAPLWKRPAALGELLTLFREGRAVVGRDTASNALDFAQALGRLGIDRGIDHFERYAFEQRFGNMYLGVPLDRRRVERNPNADLIADLARGGWLVRARSALRGKGVAASLLALGRQLDEALFRIAEDRSSDAVRQALIALGALAFETGRRPKLRESLPPPRLSADWASAAEDDSHEFLLAAALASLDAATEDHGFRMPFRRHLAPLGWPKGREGWDDTTEAAALTVWTSRNLVRDMTSVLERRLTEAQRRSFVRRVPGSALSSPELPLRGWKAAPLAAVAAFLAGRTDHERIAALALGLAWVGGFRRPLPTGTDRAGNAAPTPESAGDENAAPISENADENVALAMDAPEGEAPATDEEDGDVPAPGAQRPPRADALPLVYAALKPLFHPKGAAAPRPPGKENRRYGKDDARGRKIVDPSSLIRLLAAGRAEDAVIAAHRIARGAGLAVSFPAGAPASPAASARIAAALLIPISDVAVETLAWRAYPDLTRDKEEPDAA